MERRCGPLRGRSREPLTETVSPYLLRRPGALPGQRVCDIGCGGGPLTIRAGGQPWRRGGEALGVDLSALWWTWPGTGPPRPAPFCFVQLDVQTGTLRPGPFDLVASQFGVMFFDEPTACLSAHPLRCCAGRPLRLRLLAGCRDATPGTSAPHCGRCSHHPLPLPGNSPVGPFALGDDEYVHELLEAAGFGVRRELRRTTRKCAPLGAA